MKVICNKLQGKTLKRYYSRTDCTKLNAEDLLVELRKIFDLQLNKLMRHEFQRRRRNPSEIIIFADCLQDKITLGNLVPISEQLDYIIEAWLFNRRHSRFELAITSSYAPVWFYRRITGNILSKESLKLNAWLVFQGVTPRNVQREVMWEWRRKKKSQAAKNLMSHCFHCNEVGHYTSNYKRVRRIYVFVVENKGQSQLSKRRYKLRWSAIRRWILSDLRDLDTSERKQL